MPKKSTRPENCAKLLQVMKSDHEQNKGISEEKVYQDVERAVAELRQEEYNKQKKLHVVLDSVPTLCNQ